MASEATTSSIITKEAETEKESYVLVDTEEAVTTAIAQLEAIPMEIPIAVDCEGMNLSRDGKLSIVSVGKPDGPVLLFDIIKLGN